MAKMNMDRSEVEQRSPRSLPSSFEPSGRSPRRFGLWETPQHSHRDIHIYIEPPRVRPSGDWYQRFIFSERLRSQIPRIFTCLTSFHSLVTDEYILQHCYDTYRRRALYLILQETSLLFARTSFAIQQFSLTPTSWVSIQRLNAYFEKVSQDHADLVNWFRRLQRANDQQMAIWRNFRLFY